MKIKRIVAFLSIIVIMFTTFDIDIKKVEASGEITKDNIIEKVNEYIREYYNINYDFYPEYISGAGYVDKDRVWEEYQKYGVMINPIVYNERDAKEKAIELSGETLKYTGNIEGTEIKTIGKDVYGEKVVPFVLTDKKVNPQFYIWKSGWDKFKLNRTPLSFYAHEGVKNNYRYRTEFQHQYFSGPSLSEDKRQLMEDAMQEGLDWIYTQFPGKIHDAGDKPRTKDDYISDAPQPKSGKWTDYLLVVIPPTDISWGISWRFNVDKYGGYHIIKVPIVPFNMVAGDISASYLETHSSAYAGEKVTFKANIASNMKYKEVDYGWNIRTESGAPISVSYSGLKTTQTGIIEDVKKGGIYQIAATFTMPEEDVIVEFGVDRNQVITESNENNNTPENNPVTVKLKKETDCTKTITLDFDVIGHFIEEDLSPLTATMPYNLEYIGAGKADISARIPYEMGFLAGQIKYAGDFYDNTITATPKVMGWLLRSELGDDPTNRIWKENGRYPFDEKITTNGKVYRNYTTRHGDATDYGVFTPLNVDLNVIMNVYNGKQNLKQTAIKQGVSGNTVTWESDPIEFSVVRKMRNVNVDGSTRNIFDVPGQFKRTFTAQNKASVNWGAAKGGTQAEFYKADRANPQKSSKYAIFASDKDFVNVPYPIKSGYKFNPVGTYVCTVSSSTYYDFDTSEEEKARIHEELVKKAIESFVYNNELTYTTNGTNAYTLKNVKKGNESGILKIKRSDSKKSVYAEVTCYEACMEGYEASGTQDSYDYFKYREYADETQVCRFDATTTITFTIGPDSARYTHIGLEDGNYTISARSNPFTFRGYSLPGTKLNDGITVSVRGSMYDDRS